MQSRLAVHISCLFIISLSIGATAHEPKDFTILLSEDSTIPESIGEGVLVETDSLFFINVDGREGAKHRIQIDADGDGVFNGSDDTSTDWLQDSCELDENGSKVDSNCMVTASVFLGPQNGLLPGNVSMLHQVMIEGELSSYPFFANFGTDKHTPISPEISQDNLEENNDRVDSPLVLLLVFSIIGIIITAPKLLQSEDGDHP